MRPSATAIMIAAIGCPLRRTTIPDCPFSSYSRAMSPPAPWGVPSCPDPVSFVLPSSFGSLDLVADGIRLVIVAQDGSMVADVTVPGGTGWSEPNEKRFQFADPSGMHNGITKFQLSDQSSKAPGQAGIKLTAKNGGYPVEAGDEPLRAIVVVGDGSVGECTETAFASDACVFNGAGSAVRCK
jgi:hypothetical protein